jgi:hypothetical protein
MTHASSENLPNYPLPYKSNSRINGTPKAHAVRILTRLQTRAGLFLLPRAPGLTSSPVVDRTMADRSLTLVVAALLLVLAIVVFFVVLGDYLFQPMSVQ